MSSPILLYTFGFSISQTALDCYWFCQKVISMLFLQIQQEKAKCSKKSRFFYKTAKKKC